MSTLTRADLDRASCSTPGCDHTTHEGLTFHGRCHPSAPTWATYLQTGGVLVVRCAVCGTLIARLSIAET